MLSYINPEAKPLPLVTIFSKVGCPFCAKAKALLEDHGLQYEEITLNRQVTTKTLKAVSGAATTPQVFIDGKLIGGSEALEAYLKN